MIPHWSSAYGDPRETSPWHIRLGPFEPRAICGAREMWSLDRVDRPSANLCPKCAAMEPKAALLLVGR